MRFRDVLAGIEGFEAGAAVYVGDRFDLSSAALVQRAQDDDPPPEVGSMRLLMEIWQIRDTLDGLRQLLKAQHGNAPSEQELFDRLLIYLRRDA